MAFLSGREYEFGSGSVLSRFESGRLKTALAAGRIFCESGLNFLRFFYIIQENPRGPFLFSSGGNGTAAGELEKQGKDMDGNLKALELPKILARLAALTACEDARSEALGLEPSCGLPAVRALLDETEAAYVLTARFGAPSFGGLKNIGGPLRRAQAGGLLSMAELLDVALVLSVIRGLVSWREMSAGRQGALDGLFGALSPNRYLEDRIGNAILSETEMADSASPELRDIRRKKRAQEAGIRDRLAELIHSAANRSFLQDAIVTQRNGRFVVPVKAEHRNEISGLVHDTSNSGATVFIEPSSVIEANNGIRVLESRERDEIERILLELSGEAGGFADSILAGYACAVRLNLIFAKASLAFEMDASLPLLNDEGIVELKRARHPLLDKNRAVPIDIALGEDYDVLVITGPNTGGKTVSIKTLGLLTLMAECGLFIPAAESSRICVFRSVLADIGEEQSIEQSLSAFSAHMTNIVSFSVSAGEGSLVLLDELGAGTDPVEGAALAVAVLEDLRRKGAKIAATTHYSELKAYALRTARVENASCEFSSETLRPTYRLLTGLPGRSNAFAVSERLGLPAEVIEAAARLISAEDARFEDVVATLERTRIEMEAEKERTAELGAEAEKIKARAEETLRRARETGEKELSAARDEAKRLVGNAKRAAASLLMELDRLKREQKSAQSSAELAKKVRSELRQRLSELDDLTAERGGFDGDDADYVLPRPLRAGDAVFVRTLGTEADVLVPPDGSGSAEVRAGAMKLKVNVSELRLLAGRHKPEPEKTVRAVRETAEPAGKSGLDLRGETAEDALLDLDRFLDGALRAGLSELTIIHGKGTGTLRRAVQQRLKGHPSVKAYRTGVYGEGEEGVTIVELK